MWQDRAKTQLQQALDRQVNSLVSKELHQALTYVLKGGKRIRALLIASIALDYDHSLDVVLPAMMAIEMLHAYSLVHDDLPAMDDDDYRRGKLSCHKQFDEAVAILVGDGLQSLAFEVLSTQKMLSADCALEQIKVLSRAVGIDGMVGGQHLDILGIKATIDQKQQLINMYQMKTGQLIQASCLLGALGTHLSEELQIIFAKLGLLLGLAFQVQDDILDVTGDLDSLGKQQGSDERQGKVTFVTILGLEKSKEYVTDLHQQTLDQLDKLDRPALHLRDVISELLTRTC